MSRYFFKENKRTGRDNVCIEDANIIFRNFSGDESKFNRAGDRNFHVVIDDPDFADELTKLGWNVKEHLPKDKDDEPYYTVKCTVSYKLRPPKICLYSGRRRTNLDEDTIEELDYVDIVTCDLELNGSRWEVNGNVGIKAYVSELHVTMNQSAFDDKYSDYE